MEKLKAKITKWGWSNILFYSFMTFLVAAYLFTDWPQRFSAWVTSLTLTNPAPENNKNQFIEDKDFRLALQHVQTGDTIVLTEIKDKTIFLNIWATWCGPCVAEIPSIEALYNKTNKDIEFILLSSEDKKVVQNFVTNRGIKVPVYTYLMGYSPFIETQTFPTTRIIDNQHIVFEEYGAKDWNSSEFVHYLNNLTKK